MSKFVDQVKIHIAAGNGGNGSVSFRREKYIPRGGPDGGDGGNGGSIIFVGDHNLGTLLDYRYNRHHAAESGAGGSGNNKSGKGGEDLILPVPVGTMIFDDETGELLIDITDEGERFIAAQGGSGGWGNSHFKSSTNRSPRRANPGAEGGRLSVRMELKLLADVGLVGYPNAGKSTLISRISAAKPKIADYPFTTLTPNLGVVKWADYKTFVVADVPGLIEGASEGKGLGLQFLKHLERTRLILHLIDPVVEDEGRSPLSDYHHLRRELENFSADLAAKPEMIVVTKKDSLTPDQTTAIERELADLPQALFISAVAGEGLEGLKKSVGAQLEAMGRGEDA